MAIKTNKMPTSSSDASLPSAATGKIWDIPLRLFHWLLMFAVIGAVISAKTANWFWHEKMGLMVLGLIGFRIIWGLIGTDHARFSRFPLSLNRVIQYIRSRLAGDRTYTPGHAPTGAWATIILLAVLGAMAGFGTMANNDILFEGPLAAWVGAYTNTATYWHRALERVLFAVLIAHLAAMLTYRVWLKINLVPAMVTGGEDKKAKPFSRRHQMIGVALLLIMVVAAQTLGLLGERYYL